MDFPYFVVVTGEDKDKKLPVHPGSGHLVGRHSDASYRLRDLHVGRYHCMINNLEGTVTVMDQGGPGGTLVNGVPIQSQDLQHADTLQVGETVMRFLTRPLTEADLARGVAAKAEYDPRAVDELAALAGTEFGHFKLREKLGQGSAAMVFRAKDLLDGSTVALKVLQPDYATHEEDKKRFVRAMQAQMPLDHPNIVRVLGAGQCGKNLWASMELVEGESLATVMKKAAGPLDWRISFRVALRIGRALAYAHERGVLHRDLSPASILIRMADREVKLEDLMLAKVADGRSGHIARPDELIGDVNYMSPERTAGGAVPIDHRSDLFSLGATCYALLTKKPPFQAGTIAEMVAHIRTSDPPPPRMLQPSTPSAFEDAVLKLLAKHPSGRYQSAAQLVAALEAIGQANTVKA